MNPSKHDNRGPELLVYSGSESSAIPKSYWVSEEALPEIKTSLAEKRPTIIAKIRGGEIFEVIGKYRFFSLSHFAVVVSVRPANNFLSKPDLSNYTTEAHQTFQQESTQSLGKKVHKVTSKGEILRSYSA